MAMTRVRIRDSGFGIQEPDGEAGIRAAPTESASLGRRDWFGAGQGFGAGLLTPPTDGPEVSRGRVDLRSCGWFGRETGHNFGREAGHNFGTGRALGRSLVVAAIRGYQRWISPYKGFHCAHRRLHQGLSCSEFALQAVLERGVLEALPGIRNQFRECRDAAHVLRQQRRAARLSDDTEGYALDDDYDEEEPEDEERMITDRFYEESEKKRKRLQELKSGDPHYSDCPDWCFFSCGTCEFIEPYCCWTPW